MIDVHITDGAKRILEARLQASDHSQPLVMVQRQGPIGDLSRGASGEANWSIERRHPWTLLITGREGIEPNDERLVMADGVPVFLALIPRPGERGIVISAQAGEVHVEAAP